MKKKRLDVRPLVATGLPLLLLLGIAVTSQMLLAQSKAKPESADSGPSTEIVLASEVNWTPLNAARGDASPQAGTLWGDRAGDRQTGFLVKFADGFSSPPHIHNVTYRGVVISGRIHNDDPDAAEMWMPTGSFWTQPAGEVHITAAKGAGNMAFIEIERGPYLVWPPEKASDKGERPVNVDASNLVWLSADDTTWITVEGPQIAFLWGDPAAGEPGGTLLKLPAGFPAKIVGDSSLKAVVISGRPEVPTSEHRDKAKRLEPGSLIRSRGAASHEIRSPAGEQTMLYLRSDAPVRVLHIDDSN